MLATVEDETFSHYQPLVEATAHRSA